MADSSRQQALVSERRLPPGTVILENGENGPRLDHVQRTTDGQIILHPQPSADPNDPLNWSHLQKSVNFAIVCFFTLIIFTVLDITTICWGAWVEEFGFSYYDLNNTYAANLATLAVGCVLFIPMALLFGRKSVYIFTSVAMVGCCVGMAYMDNLTKLFGLQAFQGLAGATSESLIQLTVADMFFVHQRATMNGIYTLMVVTGTFLAPIAAGYIINSQGWRWTFWWCTIFSAISALLFIFVYEETKYTGVSGGETLVYLNSLDESSAFQNAKVHKSTDGASDGAKQEKSTEILMHQIDQNQNTARYGYLKRMKFITMTPGISSSTYLRHMYQPFILLVRIPAVSFVAFQYGIILCWIAILATTQATLFLYPPYNFTSIGIGNLNLAPFLGCIIGVAYGGPLNDMYVIWLAKRRNGIYEPESRLHMLVLPLLVTPAGLWLYGISLAQGRHWLIPCIGSTLVGVGINSSGIICLTYLSDAYRDILGDALIAVAFMRNGLSTAITFAISPWEVTMGIQNMFILVGALCFVVLLTFIPMVILGRRSRVWTADYYEKMSRKQFL